MWLTFKSVCKQSTKNDDMTETGLQDLRWPHVTETSWELLTFYFGVYLPCVLALCFCCMQPHIHVSTHLDNTWCVEWVYQSKHTDVLTLFTSDGYRTNNVTGFELNVVLSSHILTCTMAWRQWNTNTGYIHLDCHTFHLILENVEAWTLQCKLCWCCFLSVNKTTDLWPPVTGKLI